jgi:hypothetical protein
MSGTSDVVPGTDVSILPGLISLLEAVDKVRPDPANPRRTVDLKTLVGSLRRFGLRVPIVANRRDGLIEKGHQTYYALRELGATHVAVLWADDERSVAEAYNVADNRTSEVVAEWDERGLVAVLKEIEELEGIGFTEDQVTGLVSSFDIDVAVLEVPDELPITGFEGGGGGMLASRVVIMYDGDEEKKELEGLLGVTIDRVLYRFSAIRASGGSGEAG